MTASTGTKEKNEKAPFKKIIKYDFNKKTQHKTYAYDDDLFFELQFFT